MPPTRTPAGRDARPLSLPYRVGEKDAVALGQSACETNLHVVVQHRRIDKGKRPAAGGGIVGQGDCASRALQKKACAEIEGSIKPEGDLSLVVYQPRVRSKECSTSSYLISRARDPGDLTA